MLLALSTLLKSCGHTAIGMKRSTTTDEAAYV